MPRCPRSTNPSSLYLHRPGENRRNLPPLLPVAGHSRQDTVAPLCGRRQAEDSYGILDTRDARAGLAAGHAALGGGQGEGLGRGSGRLRGELRPLACPS